jgi:hypothetical protein
MWPYLKVVSLFSVFGHLCFPESRKSDSECFCLVISLYMGIDHSEMDSESMAIQGE